MKIPITILITKNKNKKKVAQAIVKSINKFIYKYDNQTIATHFSTSTRPV
jgi:hypothetical protein